MLFAALQASSFARWLVEIFLDEIEKSINKITVFKYLNKIAAIIFKIEIKTKRFLEIVFFFFNWKFF